MGIRNLTKADMRLFAGRDRVVKLLGRAVQRDGRYAVSVEPVALPMRSLEANVPSNFNLVTLEGATVGELKFYGQGAGSLPTGNAMVQDLLDLRDGRRPAYDFSRQLDYDPSLLAGDYVLRTSAAAPVGSIPFARGAWVMRNRTAAEARSILDEALVDDPTSLIALLPQED
jgi:homoserine dehydrogenase